MNYVWTLNGPTIGGPLIFIEVSPKLYPKEGTKILGTSGVSIILISHAQVIEIDV